jgi:hypothetical protein
VLGEQLSALGFYPNMPPNNRMHPTANRTALIRKGWMLDTLCARRVMPGVRSLASVPSDLKNFTHVTVKLMIVDKY